MRSSTSVLLITTLMLAGCGWFGQNERVPRGASPAETNPLIPDGGGIFSARPPEVEVYPGSPIDAVTALVIERVPGGAIVRASGVSALQGVYDVRLTSQNEEELPVNGVLTYRLEGIRDPGARRQGTQASREVTAARKLTDQMLRGVNAIRVEGLQNARVLRR